MVKLISINFLIISFGLQYKSLFQRDLQFKLLALIEMASVLIGFIIALYCAQSNYGAYSLINAFIGSSVISSVGFLLFGLKKHIPQFQINLGLIKPYLSFGSYQMGEKTINYFNSQFDILIIGKILGPEALGAYSISKQLIMRPSQIINPILTKVSFPIMAKVQSDTIKLKNIYLQTINYLSSVNFPLYLGIFLLAEEAVLLVLGADWIETIPLIKILSLYAAFRSTINPIGSLTLAVGRAKLGFLWNLSLLFLIPITIYIGTFSGVLGVCYSLLVFTILLSIPNWYFQVKNLCGANFIEYHWVILKCIIISLISTIPVFVSLKFVDGLYLRVLTVFVIGLPVSYLVNNVFNESFIATFKKLLGR